MCINKDSKIIGKEINEQIQIVKNTLLINQMH